MSFVPISTAATSAATAAALQKHQQKLREEEEQMTPYSGEDLGGWEFKIVRASTRKFKRPEIVRQVCEEEARAGWEMLEKFDDYRIRFKRKTDNRPNDQFLKIDPYRTSVGLGMNHIMVVAVGLAALGVGVAIAMAIISGR